MKAKAAPPSKWRAQRRVRRRRAKSCALFPEPMARLETARPLQVRRPRRRLLVHGGLDVVLHLHGLAGGRDGTRGNAVVLVLCCLMFMFICGYVLLLFLLFRLEGFVEGLLYLYIGSALGACLKGFCTCSCVCFRLLV